MDSLKRYWLAGGLGMLWAGFVLVAQLAGAFQELEEPLLDWRQSLPAPPPVPDATQNLALVAIDYVPADRPWPWPRLDYVILLRSLLPYAPRSIVFENLLHDRDTRYSAFDSTFGALVDRMDHVVFAAAALTADTTEPAPSNLTPLRVRGSLRTMPRFGSALWPLDTFAANATVGVSNLLPETSGQVRALPLLFTYKNRVIPSLALQAAAQYLNASWKQSEAIIGQRILLRSENGTILKEIPIDDQGRLRLRFRPTQPAPWTASFGDIPVYAQQRERGETPERNLTELRGKQVWIGRTDHKDLPALGRLLPPLSTVELNLLGVADILNGDFLRSIPLWCLGAAYILFGTLATALFLRYGWVPGAVFEFLALWVWWETSFLVFRSGNIDLPLLSFTLLAAGLPAIAYAAREWDLKPDDGKQLTLKLK